MTLCAFSGSLSPNISPNAEGIICQDTPNLSLSQPHLDYSPPSAVSFSHSSSTSACVLQFTYSQMPSENLKDGPPCSALNCCPASWNETPITASPARITLSIFEFSKSDV